MPWLDVSDVLTDPFFLDTSLQVIRNANVTGNDGIAALSQTTTPFSGVVTMVAGSVISRLADGERSNTTIKIHTKYNLIDGQVGYTADIVVWQGAQWTVKYINAYSRYGAGFVEAICEILTLQGTDR
jgi:galactose-6-phosphate isomerase